MDALIHDRGRGPEIVGTRITVYDVLDYARTRTPEFIAELFKIEVEQVHAALTYVEEHREEVMSRYVHRSEWVQPPYAPEVQARLDAGSHQFEKLDELRRMAPARFREVWEARQVSHDRYVELLERHHSEMTREAGCAVAPC